MVMSAFGLMILLCLLSVCILVKSASILEKSGDLQNWLLNENEEVPSQQSSPLSRRITPKSVFIAPSFSRCAEGYRLDAMGNCVKIVRLNEAAQWELLLERLKIMSAQFGFDKRQSESNDNNNDDSAEKPDPTNKPDAYAPSSDKDNTGPFQLSIPFNSNKNSSAENQFNVDSTTGTIAITSTDKPKEIFTTIRASPSTQSTQRITENPFGQQNTYSADSTSTEEYMSTLQDTTNTPEDDSQNTEGTLFSVESTSTESDIITTVGLTTEEPVPESTLNTASHFCPNCDDGVEDATEMSTTPVVVRRVPNYSSIVPLKSVGAVNENVERVSVHRNGVTATKSNPPPLGSYTESRVDDKPSNAVTSVHSTSSPAPFKVNNREDIIADSSNLFPKLPPNERTKPKCDPSRYNCVLQFNILPTDKPPVVGSRKPSTAFVRFPEPQQKGYIRFPVQKVPSEYQDVAYAESNPVPGYWDGHYATSWWTSSWKSKPQFIRIVPETNGMYAVGDMNYIRSHPHFQTQTEWYTAK